MPSIRPGLEEIFETLTVHYGPVHWWPGESPFEVMVGAVLTQNTSWKNVEKALANLKRCGLLTVRGIDRIDEKELAPLIRSSGYFNQKARKLKALVRFIEESYGGSIMNMRKVPAERLREELLSIHGIGPETADSILLYALEKPVFVVDAYTQRIFSRHYLLSENLRYDQVQHFFTSRLRPDRALFNEFHGLIVHVGKDYCRKKPMCAACPLDRFPHKRFPS